jgi:hypothetical protein
LFQSLQHSLRSTSRVDWSQFEPVAALRCTLGVAVPLVAGLVLGQASIGVFGAVGALSVGFGSFQGAYRSRATIMVAAAAGMAFYIFAGSLAGHTTAGAVAMSTLWGFASGFLVAIGPAASFVGLQSGVAAIVACGFPSDIGGATGRFVAVLAGGAAQTILVVVLWPLRRFEAERRALASVYRSLAAYAASLPQTSPIAPEPHTLAGAVPTFSDPQPFAKVGEVLVFRALLDEAERIRASLAALALHQPRRAGQDAAEEAALPAFITAVAATLEEIAAALEEARDPVAATDMWNTLEASAKSFTRGRRVADSLLGQLRAAWRTAGILTNPDEGVSPPDAHVPMIRRVPPMRDALHTLHANLTLQSTAFRHAVRLAVTLALATAIYRIAVLPRGYWMPLTALLVLKPEFHETFATALARMGGTILGAVGASVITVVLEPGQSTLTMLVLAFVWCGYAFFRTNYTIFTICMTGYVVFLLALAGTPEVTAALYRSIDTVLGGALALLVYGIWPTWEAPRVRERLAATLEAHADYVSRLLKVYLDPARRDIGSLPPARAIARLARSNAEASVDRMLGEPPARQTLDPGVAVGILAAIRRYALALLALQARLERGTQPSVPGLDRLATEITAMLRALAAALRDGTPPANLPPLRQTYDALRSSSQSTLIDETDLMVDSLNTIADLLR